MRGRPLAGDLWAKFAPPERGGPAWHPLVDHSTDVACVLEALLARPTIRHRLARAGGLSDLDAVQVARLCYLAFLHDLGKCCRGFRAKAAERPASTCGHIAALKPLFSPDCDLLERFAGVLDAPTLEDWCGDALDPLLMAVVAHHGRPVDLYFNRAQDNALREAWLAKDGDDPFAHLRHLLGAGRALFGPAFGDGSPLPAAPAFQHLFAGLLMLADWLGSGSAACMFPFAEPGHGPRTAFARRRAGEVLGRIGLDAEPLRVRLAGDLPSFEEQFRYPPRPAQAAIDGLPLPEGGVALIESETGSGKTEAALRWATRLLVAGQVDGLFFAVPLRSAAVQLHERLQSWLDRTFPGAGAEALLAVPGYFRMGGAEGHALPDFAVQWTDDLPDDRRLARWAAEQPKRYAAATFAVGTIDQALLAVLQTAHAHLRAACLVRHLLVVDEVHASDPYMRALVGQLIALFRACGGHVLLMSATLGAAARTELLHGRRTGAPPLAEATAAPYPLITASFGAPVAVATDARTKRVAVEILPLLDDPAGVAAPAADAAGEGARVLVLRNTVGAAIDTQAALEGRLGVDHPALFRVNGTATLHHGRYAAEDRRLLDGAIQARVGKDAPAGPAVVVATQTVEQSLDVDFDLILTDLCPVDVLLQRIGRLHRHERKREPPFRQARCLVLGPASGDLTGLLAASRHALGFGRDGNPRAYPDLRAIEAVRRLVGGGTIWTIPDDNRRLVEAGTHPEALERIALDLGGPWPKHGGMIGGQRMAQGGQALDNAIDFRKPFSDLAFPDPQAIKIATRLGLDDLLLPLERPIRSPFGATLDRLRIPGWMVRPETWAALGRLDEPRIGVAPDGTLTLGGQSFGYDRFGLRPADRA